MCGAPVASPLGKNRHGQQIYNAIYLATSNITPGIIALNPCFIPILAGCFLFGDTSQTDERVYQKYKRLGLLLSKKRSLNPGFRQSDGIRDFGGSTKYKALFYYDERKME
jgi:hypothetical protein